LKRVAKIYGFGSHFSGARTPNSDIDLLIVHEDLTPTSIRFAIRCKCLLLVALPSAHLVMLSEQEERELGFIHRSKAAMLESIVEDRASDQVLQVAERIANL
jgi:predicted nucleotidyltransferase